MFILTALIVDFTVEFVFKPANCELLYYQEWLLLLIYSSTTKNYSYFVS